MLRSLGFRSSGFRVITRETGSSRYSCYRAPASAVGCTESDAHSYGGARGGAGGVGDPLKVYAYISGKEKRVKIQETALRFCRTCLRSI